MKIIELFAKDINRSINGVVKAEQLDDASVCQELEEFVITTELGRYLDKYFSVYVGSIDNPNDPDISGKIGIWISGFFGSGKSHFIKVLSYIQSNRPVTCNGQTKNAVEFLNDKVQDAMLLGNIRRSVAANSDVILFNIDSKADQSKGRDAILAVFLKVLNELQGYSPDHPHIAHMERYLDSKGKYDDFKSLYQQTTGRDWLHERDSYMFNQDEIIGVLAQTLGQSKEACHRWIDNAESDFTLSVENFAKWVKEYLAAKGKDHRIIFFVDEIGQFIGQDGHLMLNLQTIVENLGVVCKGRAWVVVTSQEDIDKVLGSVSNARSNDFSKIQGRFKTRLSLSSSNADEVIQARLIEKKPEVTGDLEALYKKNADILKNQLSFSKVSISLKSYGNEADFVRNYPFVPYQFYLIQRVFETIRRAGATGVHLSRGERSMLDAFQYAGQIASSKEVGALVPLYWFYPSIESFLDTAIKRTIEQAKEKATLHEFDIQILQALFMIRYVNEIKGNVDNLVTLCIDRIDADRFALRSKIEQSLNMLEKEHLVGRSGEDYFFLTNEERDISREISNVELEFGAESRELGTIVFEDILKGNKKHRYEKTGKDFDLNRLCDLYAVGGSIEDGLVVSVVTPFCEDCNLYDKAKCILESSNNNGNVLLKTPEQAKFDNELRLYLKTEKYIARKNAANPEVERILRERKEENRQRKGRLIEIVKEMLSQSDIYVAGQPLKLPASDPITLVSDALDYLVDNTFSKMKYIEHPCVDPEKEASAVLRANDIGQETLKLKMPEFNPKAAEEIRQYIDLCTRTSKQLVLHDLVTKKFSSRPYGWSDWETMLLLTRLIVAGEVQFVMHGDVLETKRIYEQISKTSNWRKITLKQRRRVDSQLLEKTRALGKELFAQMGPDNEDGLLEFFRQNLTQWQASLKEYKTLADTGSYPGAEEIAGGLTHISVLLADKDSFTFFTRVNELKKDLLDFAEDFHDIDNFYKTQRAVWEKLRKEHTKFQLNHFELDKDTDAAPAMRRMKEILDSKSPYSIIHEADALIKKVAAINNTLVSTYRKQSLEAVEKLLDELGNELTKAQADSDFRTSTLKPLAAIKSDIGTQESIAHLQQAPQRASSLFQKQVEEIGKYIDAKQKQKPNEPKPVVKPVITVKTSSMVAKTYLETQDDVDEFVSKLKAKLSEEVGKNNRIRID